MANLLNVEELSLKTGWKVSKIRRYTKAGIFAPVSKDSINGKSLLYHLGCVEMKLQLIEEFRIDFSLKELGERIQNICGKRNKVLLKMINKTKEDETFEKLKEKIIAFKNNDKL